VRCPVTHTPLNSSALREWERIAAGPVAAGAVARRRTVRPFPIARLAAQALLVALLPFLVLVKVAVFLYTREGYSTVLALACGTACTAAIVTAYGALVWHHFTGRVRLALVADPRRPGPRGHRSRPRAGGLRGDAPRPERRVAALRATRRLHARRRPP